MRRLRSSQTARRSVVSSSNGGSGLIPSPLVEMNSRARFIGGALMDVGEAAAQLLERARQAALEPEIRERARAGGEERADLVFAEEGQGAAVALGKRDPAGRAAFRIDRHAGGAQRIDVAVDRALRDLELARPAARAALPPRLQQQQERDEPVGLHGSIKLRQYDRLCQLCLAQSRWAGKRGGLGAVFPTPLAKGRVRIKEFADLPQYYDDYSPSAIASGPRHSLWVTDDIDQDYGENLVARIDTSGTLLKTFYYQGRSTEGSSFQDITAGPDGALWITDYYDSQIVRMTTDGVFSTFSLKTEPLGITVGRDKALWFTEYSAIGRITTKGSVTIYPAGDLDNDITAGPDGALLVYRSDRWAHRAHYHDGQNLGVLEGSYRQLWAGRYRCRTRRQHVVRRDLYGSHRPRYFLAKEREWLWASWPGPDEGPDHRVHQGTSADELGRVDLSGS